MTWKGPLQGIVTPLATPLCSQDVIDKDGTAKLMEHVIDGGVAGIFILGSTGEGPSLSCAAKKEFIEYCCRITNQRVPVLVSISDTAFGETIALANVAQKAGASAVVLVTPYYFTMSQTELMRYAERVVETIPADLPLLLYNIPFLTKQGWEVETVRTLAKRYPNIVGIKDSSGDLDYFQELCTLKEERPDFTVMIGPEHLLTQAIKLGGDGGVNGGSNIAPKLFASLYRATVDGDTSAVERLMQSVDKLQELYQVANSDEHPFSRFIAATKSALAVKKICRAFVNEPFTELTRQEQSKVEGILDCLQALSES